MPTLSRIKESKELWERVFHEATKLEKPKGYVLLEYMRDNKFIYYLHKGEVSCKYLYLDGQENLITKINAPALIGDATFFIDKTQLIASLHLETDCVIYAFSEEWVYTKLLIEYPELTLSLLRNISLKTVDLIKQKVLVKSNNIPAVICRFLQFHIKQEGAMIFANPNLNQQELANFLNIHRVSLNKALRKLELDGIISPYKKNETYILDLDKFNAILENDNLSKIYQN